MHNNINGRDYEVPVVTVEAGKLMYRGLNMPCKRVYETDPNTTMFVSPSIELAKLYGTCVETYKLTRPISLLDLWTAPVIEMLQQELPQDVQYSFRYFSGQTGTQPRMKVKEKWNDVTGQRSVTETPNPIAPEVHAVLPDSELINNGTAVRWRGLVWGDTDQHLSRNSTFDGDSIVYTAIRELLRDQVDGIFAVRTPSRRHEDPFEFIPFFHEETLVFRPGSAMEFVNRDETGQHRYEAVDYSRAMLLGRQGSGRRKMRKTVRRRHSRRKMTSKHKK